MKKIILFSIMLIVVLGIGQIAYAEAVTPEGYYFDEVSGLTYKLDAENSTAATYIYGTYDGTTWTYNTTSTADVIIPATIEVDGVLYDVTKIGEYTFAAAANKRGNTSAINNTKTTSITMPEGIIEIESNAFYSCRGNIEEIQIPSTVTKLGSNAFLNSNKIKRIIFNGNNITEIPDSCFAKCESLESIDFPESVVAINMAAFKNTYKLATVKIRSENVTFIGEFPVACGIAPSDISAGGTGKVETVFYVKNETVKSALQATAEENPVSSNKTYDISGIKDGSQIMFFFKPTISTNVKDVVCINEDLVFDISIFDQGGTLNTVEVLYDGEVVFEENEILSTDYTAEVTVDAEYVKQGDSVIEIIAEDTIGEVLTYTVDVTAVYAEISDLVKSSSLTAGAPVTASFKFCNVSGNEKSITVLYGIYDENDSLLKLSVKGKILAPSQEEPFTISVDVPSDKDVTKLKAHLYVWEGSFNFNPLMID